MEDTLLKVMRSATKVTVVCCLILGVLSIEAERRLKDPHVGALHPMVNVVSFGLANAKDDAGRQMSLVNLTISNVPNKFASVLYVRGIDRPKGAPGITGLLLATLHCVSIAPII
jgi:hypothetical protein